MPETPPTEVSDQRPLDRKAARSLESAHENEGSGVAVLHLISLASNNCGHSSSVGCEKRNESNRREY